MPRLVAFLRAINVGGHVVTMDALRGHCTALGLGDVETFLASGNVVFTAKGGATPALERRIERALAAALRYEVRTFVRTGEEVAALAASRPFPAADIAAARAFCVGFLTAPLTAAQRKALDACASPDDRFAVTGREFWWLARHGQGQSAFSNAVFEKRVGASTTIRGMSTMTKLVARFGFGGGGA